MHERPFVLRPLVDLEPDLVHPLLMRTVTELLEEASFEDEVGVRVLPLGVHDGETRFQEPVHANKAPELSVPRLQEIW